MIAKLFERKARSQHPRLSKAEMEALSQASIQEARGKEVRLREFYKDPFGDGSERWWLAEIYLDYARLFKAETAPGRDIKATKRKDKVTENILHELNPLLLFKGNLRAGILPRRVTYEIVNDQRRQIPETLQSVEALFRAETIHDLDEDFAGVSTECFRDFVYAQIFELDLDESHKEFLKSCCDIDCKILERLTFGRKTYAENGKIITVPTFPNLQACMDAQEEYWPAVGAKPGDRYDGLITRFGEVPDVFTIDQHLRYANDTIQMFMNNQVLERMQKRYPELEMYFDKINKRLKVSLICFHAIIMAHPLNKGNGTSKSDPATARVDIKDLFDEASEGSEFLDVDALPFERMLNGYNEEEKRYPELKPLVSQIREKILPTIVELKQRSAGTSLMPCVEEHVCQMAS